MFDDFNQMMNQVIGGLNMVVCLCVAGGIAALVVGLLIFDGLRRKRKRRRFRTESRGNSLKNSYRNLRATFRGLEEELNRRRRRTERERDRRK